MDPECVCVSMSNNEVCLFVCAANDCQSAVMTQTGLKAGGGGASLARVDIGLVWGLTGS